MVSPVRLLTTTGAAAWRGVAVPNSARLRLPARRSPGVATVGNRAVSSRNNTNCLLGLGELIDDAVGADAKRAQASEAPPQYVAGNRIAFEQPERILYGIDERPIELEQLTAGAAREDDARHRSAGLAPLVEFGAHVGERDCLPARELGESGFDRGECL
jgi:hypothetical protein